MTTSYKFAVLQAMPDPTRGEIVNVGIVVAGPKGIDIRAPELRKLQLITGHEWQDITDVYSHRLSLEWQQLQDLEQVADSIGATSEVFTLSRPGTLSADTPAMYEKRVLGILDVYVNRPTLSRRDKKQKINAEIARALKNAGVLVGKGETIDDQKVVAKHVISRDKDIIADFAYKRDNMKVVATLDLRGDRAAHGKACEKGATLFFAKEKYGITTRPYGVYAVSTEAYSERKAEIEILAGFSDGNIFNWLDAKDRVRFSASFY